MGNLRVEMVLSESWKPLKSNLNLQGNLNVVWYLKGLCFISFCRLKDFEINYVIPWKTVPVSVCRALHLRVIHVLCVNQFPVGLFPAALKWVDVIKGERFLPQPGRDAASGAAVSPALLVCVEAPALFCAGFGICLG